MKRKKNTKKQEKPGEGRQPKPIDPKKIPPILNQKIKEYTPRLSLTLLFSGATLLILLAVLIVVGGISLTLVNSGILIDTGAGLVNGNQLILFILLASFLLGVAAAFLFGRAYMKPINVLINTMNRMAAGDFKARVRFSGLFAKHPAMAELTESVNTMAEELSNTEMLRADFVNNFSHEFKTPIVSIAGFAKLLGSADLTEEQKKEYIAIIEEESLHLSAMATNILNLTRIENQTILTDVTTYNLSEQLRTCLLLLENKWSEKALDLRPDFDEYNVAGSEELLRQVWINLLDNAIKFTPYGGTITVHIRPDGNGRLLTSVTNTGSTIPERDISRIFQKFYQGDTSHATRGNGVGLAIVRRIVELHHGAVWVESQNDVTTFTVALPYGG